MNRLLAAILLAGPIVLLAAACSAPPAPRIENREVLATGLSEGLGGLRDFLGEWTVTVESRAGAGAEWSTYVTSSSIRAALGGVGLEERVRMQDPAGDWCEIMGLRTWDPYRELFRVAYLDSRFGLLDVYEGGVEEDGAWVGSNTTTGTSIHHEKTEYWSRYRMRRLGPDRFRTIWEGSDDGGRSWTELNRMNYARRR
ncbi:MAG TPA: DUF1579 family protein [Planctomycetota bacterium]